MKEQNSETIKEDKFLIDIGQIANDPKDFDHPLQLILEMINKRMEQLNWLPIDWVSQQTLTHKAIQQGIDWK